MTDGPGGAAPTGATPTGATPTGAAPTGATPSESIALGGDELDQHKLAAARLWAVDRHPYLASAVFAAPVLPAPTIGRLVIDRWWRVHADPEVVATATVPELGGELLHLTSHLLRDHAGRADAQHFGEAAELHHWVDSADAEIADDFEQLPRLASEVAPDDLDQPTGRLAEEYYRLGSVREGEANDCGSGAHGDPPPWEPPPPDPTDDGGDDGDEAEDRARRSGVGVDDQQLIRRNVAARINEAGAGSVADGLRRWAAEHLVPTVDWRAELAAVLRWALSSTAGAVDYSYRRPSRRAGAVDGVILPSLARPTIEIAVVCDTSASVSDVDLGQAVAEVDGLLRASGARNVRFLSVDDRVRSVERVVTGRSVVPVGGGGTDMALGIDAALDHRPRPDLIVVLTDGYTPWPKRQPRADVVVGLLGSDPDQDGSAAGLRPLEPPSWTRVVPIPVRTWASWPSAAAGDPAR